MTDSGVILAWEAIHEKTNEIPVFREMLTYLDIEGKTVTSDAMHCQRETCRRIIQRKGNYLFGLKENQPSLLEGVRMFFEDADAKERAALYRMSAFPGASSYQSSSFSSKFVVIGVVCCQERIMWM